MAAQPDSRDMSPVQMARSLIPVPLLLLACAAAISPAAAQDLLEPEKAFRMSARVTDPGVVEIRYQIASGYYLYRDRFRFAVEPAPARAGTPELPRGEVHKDEFFGQVETYRKEVRIRLPVEGATDRIKLKVTSQGCADVGVCYVPNDQTAELRLASSSAGGSAFSRLFDSPQSSKDGPPRTSAEPKSTSAAPWSTSAAPWSTSAAPSSTSAAPSSTSAAPSSTSAAPWSTGAASAGERAATGRPGGLQATDIEVAAMFESGNFLLVLASFFGFGLLLAFTPCVLPMVPILSGIIVEDHNSGERAKPARGRAFVLSLAYVLGMAATYALAGVLAGFSGSMLAAALQNAWVLSAFALIFVWLALSMYGFHDIQLPAAMLQRLHIVHGRLTGGRIASVALMGVLSAVIVSPCVAAPLAGALLYIGQSRDFVLGGAALFVMALGMGVPLIVVGVSEGALLPRSGAWMKSVKRLFGTLLLAVAVWIVSPVLPLAAQMLAWAALFIGSAMFLRATDVLEHDAPAYARLGKALGLMLLLAGAALVIGAAAGSRDVLRPLAGVISASADTLAQARFQRIRTVAELDARIAAAGRPVMLDFYADWCVSCKEMERFTFSDPQVGARLGGLLLLQADVTANDDEDRALLRRFRLFGPPGIVFFDRDGREIGKLRVIGYQPADVFLKTLEAVARL